MSPFTKTLLIVSMISNLLGSLLPWSRQGDFVSYWTYGIKIYPSWEDNGGLLIIVLTLLVTVLIFRPPTFIESKSIWAILVSIILVVDAFIQTARVFLSRIGHIGVIGAPVIQIGLILVSTGSVLLLLSAVLYYRKLLL